LLLVVPIAGSFALPAAEPEPEPWQLTVLCSADLRGAALDEDPLTGLARQGSLLRLSAYAKDLRLGARNLLLLDAGGTLMGSPETHFAMEVAGERVLSPATALLAQLGYDAVLLGDEDFDMGLDALRGQTNLLREAGGTVLCANYEKNDALTGEEAHVPWNDAKPYKIYEFPGPDGEVVRVGVIGLLNRAAAQRNELDGVLGIVTRKMIDTYLYYEPELRAACDLIIALVHAPIEADSRLGWNEEDSVRMLVGHTRGIDLVLCGHSDRAGQSAIANQDGKMIPVVAPGSGGTHVARVQLRLLPETEGSGIEAELLAIADFPVDAVGQGQLLKMLRPIETELDLVAGTLAADVPFSGDLSAGSAWMNMLHQSQIWTARQWAARDAADLPALLSIAYPYLSMPVGERLPAGEVSLRALCRTVTETPNLSLMLVSGAELRDFLDELALTLREADPAYSLSGLNYLLDPDAPAGRRVTLFTHPDGTNVEESDVFAVLVAARGAQGSLLTRYLDEDWLPEAERFLAWQVPDMPRPRLTLPPAYEACRMLAYYIHSGQ